MAAADKPQRVTGRHVTTTLAGDAVRAFVPHPLPPSDPPLNLQPDLLNLEAEARQALKHLELAGEMVPSIEWFIYAFVRKEAVVSSQIEGTQATLVDLLRFEADQGEPPDEAGVEEVCSYLDALKLARRELSLPDGLPLSLRLLSTTHETLMMNTRGHSKQPGRIRSAQNWVGGMRPSEASFVPPPPNEMKAALSDFEHYLHAEDSLPPLIRIGLVHVQFETLHPYLDGNGRMGRLLITLLLEHWGLLSQPLLYLSLYLKQNRNTYYSLLNAVRTEGRWETWLEFFLQGVLTIATEATSTARALFNLVSADRQRVLGAEETTVTSLRLFELLPQHPVLSAPMVVELLQTTAPTANKALTVLESAGVLTETTGKKRDRSYHYARYLERLREGTEL